MRLALACDRSIPRDTTRECYCTTSWVRLAERKYYGSNICGSGMQGESTMSMVVIFLGQACRENALCL